MRRQLLLAAAVGGCVVLGAAAPHVSTFASGLTFTVRTTTLDSKGRSSPPQDSHVQYLAGTLRFDARSGGEQGASYGDGAYTLLDIAARSMTVVMPAQKQYLEFRFDSTASVMTQAMAATTRASDISVDGEALGSGGTVNGYATKHYRIVTDYTQLPGVSDPDAPKRRVHSVEEFWVSDALKEIIDPTEALTRAFGANDKVGGIGTTGTMSELMRKRGAAQRKLFTGLPIKTVTRTTTTEPDGRKLEENGAMEIVDLRKADLDPASFKVPAGYAKLDVKAMMTNVGAQLKGAFRNAGHTPGDSTADTTSVKDAATDAAKEAAKEGLKGSLKRGIMGKFKKKP